MKRRKARNVAKGMAAGLVGGLVATVVMTQFQALAGKYLEDSEESQGDQSSQEESSHKANASGKDSNHKQEQEEEDDDATAKLAGIIAKRVFHRELSKPEKKKAGSVIHYAFGSVVGALYGAVAELQPEVTTGNGLVWGTGVWATADETAVPMLGLSESPAQQPLSIHAYALSSHLVYGGTLEMVRSMLRKRL